MLSRTSMGPQRRRQVRSDRYYPEWAHREKKTYNGIGSSGSNNGGTGTVGKKRFPYRLAGDRRAVSDCLESHELAGSDHVPFLLSLPAQSSLGLVKDLARGHCILDQEGEIELCRCHRTGLLVIRIDQFDPELIPTMCRPLHISYTALDDHSEEEKTVLMAPRKKDTNDDHPLVVTMGLESFEFHPDGQPIGDHCRLHQTAAR